MQASAPAPVPVSAVPVDQPRIGTPTAPRSDGPPSRPGPRLRADERAVLRELLVRYHDIRTVQIMLRDEYPDVPVVSDRYLRELRSKLLTGQNEDLRQALQDLQTDAFGHGLAVRAHRVLELTRTHGVLLQRELGTTDPMQQTAITRERRTVLAQIAREVGDLDRLSMNQNPTPSVPHASPATVAAGSESALLAELVQMLCAKLWATEPTHSLDLSAYGPGLGDALTELQRLLQQRTAAITVTTEEARQ